MRKASKKSFKKVEEDDVKQGLLANMEEKPEFVDHSAEMKDSARKSSKRVTPRDLMA